MSPKVTMHDVARESGFGLGTVSRVLSGDKNVKPSTRAAVLDVVRKLNYVPNVNAARLRKKHIGLIAVLVPIINHPFFSEFVECLESIATEKGYSIILVSSKSNTKEEGEILRRIRMKEVDGAIFVTHYDHDDEETAGLPLVSIDRHLNNQVPFVSSDNYEATKRAIEYLVSTGAKRIGYVGTKPFVRSEVSRREQGYLDAMQEHGLTPMIVNEVVEHGEERRVVDAFLERYPNVDAIFASGNTVSNLIYAKLKDQGVKFPEEMQLISYDGVFGNWGGFEQISTIQQPIRTLAEASFNILIDIIDGKEVPMRNIYPTTFIKGLTTK